MRSEELTLANKAPRTHKNHDAFVGLQPSENCFEIPHQYKKCLVLPTVIIRMYEFKTRLSLFILSLKECSSKILAFREKWEIYLQKNKGHERTVYTTVRTL